MGIYQRKIARKQPLPWVDKANSEGAVADGFI